MERIEVQIGGKCYSSISEAARAHAVIPSTAFSRIKRGWSIEAAVTLPIQCRVGTLYNLMHAGRVMEYNKKHRKKIVA